MYSANHLPQTLPPTHTHRDPQQPQGTLVKHRCKISEPHALASLEGNIILSKAYITLTSPSITETEAIQPLNPTLYESFVKLNCYQVRNEKVVSYSNCKTLKALVV